MMLLQQTEKVQLVKCVARRGNFQNTAAWKKLSCWIFFFLQNSLLKKSSAPKAARSDLTPHLYHTRISLSTTVTSRSQQLADFWQFRCLVVDLTWWKWWHGQAPREWFSAWGRNGDTPLSHGSAKFSSAGPLRSHTGDLLQCVAVKSPLLASCQTCNNRSLP